MDKHDGLAKLEINKTGEGCQAVEVCLSSVRDSDAIRIEYDYDRDGWVIKQPKTILVPTERDNYFIHEEVWLESTFCSAWQFENENIWDDFDK